LITNTTYLASDYIEASGMINSGVSITLKATNSITLKEGFHATNSSDYQI